MRITWKAHISYFDFLSDKFFLDLWLEPDNSFQHFPPHHKPTFKATYERHSLKYIGGERLRIRKYESWC